MATDLAAIIAEGLDASAPDAAQRAGLLAELLLHAHGDHEDLAEAKSEPEDPEATAPLIADLLFHLYGAHALDHLDDVMKHAERFEGFAAGWSANDHPRGHGGRFIPRGSPEAVGAAKEVVGKVLKGDHSVSPDDVTKHLAILTVAQLRQLHQQHGVKKIPSYVLRQHLTDAVTDRLTSNKELQDLREQFKKVKGARPPDTMTASALKKQIETATGQGGPRGPGVVERKPATAPVATAAAINLNDPQALADAVHQVGADVPDPISGETNKGDMPAWQSHKPHLADVYDALKDRLGGATLDDFKAAMVRASQAGKVELSNNNMPEATHDKQGGIGTAAAAADRERSRTNDRNAEFHTVNTNSVLARKGPRGPGVVERPSAAAPDKGGPQPVADMQAVERDLAAVNQQDQRTGLRPVIPELYDRLKAKHPNLTEPQFHALLRGMHTSGRGTMQAWNNLQPGHFERSTGHNIERLPDHPRSGKAAWFQPASDPLLPTAPKTEKPESEMDASYDDWEANADRVGQDPEGSSSKDLRRAIAHQSRMATHHAGRGDADAAASFQVDVDHYKKILRDRESGAAKEPVAKQPQAGLRDPQHEQQVADAQQRHAAQPLPTTANLKPDEENLLDRIATHSKLSAEDFGHPRYAELAGIVNDARQATRARQHTVNTAMQSVLDPADEHGLIGSGKDAFSHAERLLSGAVDTGEALPNKGVHGDKTGKLLPPGSGMRSHELTAAVRKRAKEVADGTGRPVVPVLMRKDGVPRGWAFIESPVDLPQGKDISNTLLGRALDVHGAAHFEGVSHPKQTAPGLLKHDPTLDAGPLAKARQIAATQAVSAKKDTFAEAVPSPAPQHIHVHLPDGMVHTTVVNRIEPTPITVNVPRQAAPVVNVAAPAERFAEEPRGPLQVEIVKTPDRVTTTERDQQGNIKSTTQKDANAE